MIPVLGIPVYNRVDLLLRCLRSIDFPVRRIVLVNNGQIPDLLERVLEVDEIRNSPLNESIWVQEPRANIGVAGAWNWLLHTQLAQRSEVGTRRSAADGYVVICNNDIQWAPNDLERMHWAALSDPGMCAVFGNWSFSNFLVTREGVRQLGYFDENFWPAYLEDGDYWRRICVSGAKVCHAAGINSIHGENGEGSCTIHSDPDLARRNEATHQRNWIYYRAKWGFGLTGGASEGHRKPLTIGGQKEEIRETFITPFDRGGALNEWKLREERLTEPHYLAEAPAVVV